MPPRISGRRCAALRVEPGPNCPVGLQASKGAQARRGHCPGRRAYCATPTG
jgi:hypothetical protein